MASEVREISVEEGAALAPTFATQLNAFELDLILKAVSSIEKPLLARGYDVVTALNTNKEVPVLEAMAQYIIDCRP